MSTKSTDPYRTTYHRDGTITIWSCHQQDWMTRIEPGCLSDRTLATLSESERERISRHGQRHGTA